MTDGSEKRNRQLAFELHNSHVCEKRSKDKVESCSEYSLSSTSGHVTTRGVAISYFLSKTSQNIETDYSLFQNSNKRPFSVVLLFSLVLMRGSTVLFFF